MRVFNKVLLSLIVSFSMVSVASAHCGSCGTGDEKKDHKHEHKKEEKKDQKAQKDQNSCEGKPCDCDSNKGSEDKPADKSADKPSEGGEK